MKELLVKTFDLPQSVEEIPDDIAIIGEGLELDSVDVLEIVSQIDRQLGIKIKNEDIKKQAFSSIASLTEFLNAYKN